MNPENKSSQPERTMMCHNCNASNHVDNDYCDHCGASFKEPQSVEKPDFWLLASEQLQILLKNWTLGPEGQIYAKNAFKGFGESIWNSHVLPLVAQIEELKIQNENFKTVMIAAAEEIQSKWSAHCDSEGYGPSNLMHRLENAIPARYGYTAGAFENLDAFNKELKRSLTNRDKEISSLKSENEELKKKYDEELLLRIGEQTLRINVVKENVSLKQEYELLSGAHQRLIASKGVAEQINEINELQSSLSSVTKERDRLRDYFSKIGKFMVLSKEIESLLNPEKKNV